MFRFKLRTLLIATALVAVFLGLQVHVHLKEKRFSEEMREMSGKAQKRLIVEAGIDPESEVVGIAVFFEPATFADVVLIRRRAKVEFFTESTNLEVMGHIHRYWFCVFGDRYEIDSEWRLSELED